MRSVPSRRDSQPQEGTPGAELHVIPIHYQWGGGSGGEGDDLELGQVRPDPPLLLKGVNAGDLDGRQLG